MAAIAERMKRIELGEHLRRRLGTRHPAVELDDVAELAQERAAARELHADIHVVLELQQIEARDRRLGDVGLEFRCLEYALAVTATPSGDELVDDALRLAEHLEISGGIDLRARGRIGAADRDRLARGPRDLDDPQGIDCCASMPPVMTR